MKIRTTSRVLVSVVCLMSAISVGTMMLADHYRQLCAQAETNRHLATIALRDMAHGSDVLTNSVRAFAATGDETYHQEYLLEEFGTHSRDQSIEQLKQADANAEELGLLEEAKRNSDALIKLESRIFLASASGEKAKALAMAYGEEYKSAKESITGPVEHAESLIEMRINAEAETYVQLARVSLAVSYTVCVLTGVVVLLIIFRFYQRRVVTPLMRITEQARQLVAGNHDAHFHTVGEAEELDDLANALGDYQHLFSELRGQRQHLQHLYQEQQALFDTATSGIALIRGRVVEAANHQLGEIMGCNTAELIGHNFLEIFKFDQLVQQQDLVTRTLSQGEMHRYEETVVRRDGLPISVRVTGRAINPADLSVGIVWVLDDITIERQHVQEMERARFEAEDAARVKSEFLANMSHEIRTPLNGILGMSHLAEYCNSDPQVGQHLQRIHESGRHLLGVVNEILDFSKLEAGKFAITSDQFSLKRVLEHSVDLVAEKATAKGLELIIHIAPGIPDMLVGDAQHIAQILINLVANAVKFTERGDVSLSVARVFAVSEAIRLRFSVRDTGIGIALQQLSRLFQPFQQVDGSTTRRFEGTGLGLVISQQLAELMGGDVGVSSEPGQGSTFFVEIPLKLGQPDNRTATVPEFSHHRLLVADGNAEDREGLVDQLHSLFDRVDQAETGDEAIALITAADRARQPYDLVFIDWKLPDTGGELVSREIGALPLVCASPHRIALLPLTYDRGRVAELPGIDATLTKPAFGSPLFDVLIQLFEPVANRNPVDVRKRLSADPLIAGRHVLLVEDNPVNREVGVALLKLLGLKVSTANDGAQALQKLGSESFDLVLMDLHMPVMDGVEATSLIRKNERLAHLPIIALTADVISDNQEKLLQEGVNGIIDKPIDPEKLRATLIQWLTRSAPVIAANHSAPGAKAVAPNDNATLQQLRQLPELEVDAALARLLGMTDIYLNYARSVVISTTVTPLKMREAIASGEQNAGQDLVHNLKSISAGLGALRIATLCERVEEATARGPWESDRIEVLLREWSSLYDKLKIILLPQVVDASI